MHVVVWLIPTITQILYASTHICDDSTCDFGICNNRNNCADYNFICTNKASQCSFVCRTNCNNINITSFSNYTEISCSSRNSCNNIQIEVKQSNSELHLHCKKSQSCSKIKIYSHLQFSFLCEDNDNYQCSNNVQIENITHSPTIYPTSIPTVYPTTIPTTYSPTIVPSTSVTSTPTFEDIHYVTKTVVVYAHLVPQSDVSDGLTVGIILVSIILVCVCMAALIYFKFYKNRNKRNKRIIYSEEQQNINQIHIKQANILSELSDGKCAGVLGTNKTDCNEGILRDDNPIGEYDQLYEGRNQNTGKPLQNQIQIHDENQALVTMETGNLNVHLDELALPQSPTKILSNVNTADSNSLEDVEDMVESVSGDEMQLLYGPGSHNNRTRGNKYQK